MTHLTAIFKLLSDETRLRMLVLLYQENLCVCELGGILDAPQPRISKNLSKLRDLDFVIAERKEKYVFYTLKKNNPILVNAIETILSNIDNHPEILNDQNRLKEKAKYSNQCSVTQNN